MSTFEKLLHKDNRKLNRLQKEAKHYIETTGVSKMSSSSRLSHSSHSSLPDVHGPGTGRLGSGIKSKISGFDPLVSRTKTGGPGLGKNRITSSKSNISSVSSLQ